MISIFISLPDYENIFYVKTFSAYAVVTNVRHYEIQLIMASDNLQFKQSSCHIVEEHIMRIQSLPHSEELSQLGAQ